MKIIRKLSGAFTGGALGALLDSFNIWFMGMVGISDLIGITMKPNLLPHGPTSVCFEVVSGCCYS